MSTVYFIKPRGEAVVKIGVGKNPLTRRKALQLAHHRPLELLAFEPGTPRHEAELHQRFSAYAIRGEWFRYDGALRRYIRSLVTFRAHAKVQRAFAPFFRDLRQMRRIEARREAHAAIEAQREGGKKWGRPSGKTPAIVAQMKRDLLKMTVAQVAKKHGVSGWTVKEWTGGARKVALCAKRKKKR